MSIYSADELDSFEVVDRAELARVEAYIMPKLRKLSIRDLRIVARALNMYGHAEMPRSDILECVAESYLYEVCSLMVRR